MKYAVIQRPEIDTSSIEEISRKYDPYYGLVGPHITLVFPFSSEGIDEPTLNQEIQKVVSNTKPFEIRLNDTELSWDQWLFLTPDIGRQEIERLHDKLYELNVIKPHLRSDIPFVPHIALGLFAKQDGNYDLRNPSNMPLDQARYEQAKQEIDAMALDYRYTAMKIELISVADDYKSSETVSIFDLAA